MKWFSFIIIFIFFSFIIVNQVKACSCRSQGFNSANKSAATIFSGKVTFIEQINIRKNRVTIQVKQSWKGDMANSIKVFTQTAYDDACGYGFEVGKSYLIYTYKDDDGTFWVSG